MIQLTVVAEFGAAVADENLRHDQDADIDSKGEISIRTYKNGFVERIQNGSEIGSDNG